MANYDARFYEFMADPSKYGMGAVVTVQEHVTYLVIASGLRVLPGISAELTIAAQKHQLLQEPYGVCQPREYLKRQLEEDFGIELMWDYTMSLYVAISLEQMVAMECDCRDSFLIGNMDLT